MPGLVALDWGTTTCRAYLLDEDGVVVEQRTSEDGVAVLDRRATSGGSRARVYEDAFAGLCGDWISGSPGLPVVASGMVGSDRGWLRTPYVSLPFDIVRDDLPLTTVRTSLGDLHLVPGVAWTRGASADVVRGEEAQALGALLHVDPAEHEETVLVLPGTHSKWLRARGTTLTEIVTALTGELYATLLEHTVLGRGVRRPGSPQWSAFDRGLDTAGERAAEGVVLTLFSVRSLAVTGALPAHEAPDYLSGLLVGAELAGVADDWLGSSSVEPVVVGARHLQQRYARALARRGTRARLVDGDVTPAALHHIALRAGMVPAPRTARRTVPGSTGARA
ncbi:2-dehydro-3-deoxygalactonokinase [Cellulosimicrobium cellulans]|uniref:2-dehydro-3-deoxygalactonokinase n=1 Tax=Cellulosimicrobium cellulans TaxID=1710 RepID=UPI001965022B|nr:2-dehydro-3-deoxygalactonokinase [Cellulosimicrobium cellulans]MBN0040816.1 2-dehydro-3-deoxygalactonokinase [Cellulosimicrobium cellulans]